MCVKIVDFYEKYDAPIALALGFFDCIHIGHKRLATKVIEYAQSHNDVQSALFTFSNDPNTLFNKTKEIYSFEDRVCVLDNLGIDVIVKASFDESFMSTSPRDFLLKLTDKKIFGLSQSVQIIPTAKMPKETSICCMILQ